MPKQESVERDKLAGTCGKCTVCSKGDCSGFDAQQSRDACAQLLHAGAQCYQLLAGDLNAYDGQQSHKAHTQLLSPENYEGIESDLTFLGLAGLMDPPRPEVSGAIAACYKAGIKVGSSGTATCPHDVRDSTASRCALYTSTPCCLPPLPRPSQLRLFIASCAAQEAYGLVRANCRAGVASCTQEVASALGREEHTMSGCALWHSAGASLCRWW